MAEVVYGRLIVLKNCGRFLNIASDFGSEYKTHPFLTEQMVYAGLTRENEMIGKKELYVEKGVVPDKYDFNKRYGIPNGRYFTCGYIIDQKKKEEKNIKLGNKNRDNSDVNNFNSIQEDTGKTDQKKLPTFGNIESILPNNSFLVLAFALDKDYLKKYYTGQTFYMGKKRTMFQISDLSKIVEGVKVEEIKEDVLRLPIQVTNEEISRFEYYSIMTVTQRYILIEGKPKDEYSNYIWRFEKGIEQVVSLPDFYVKKKIKI